MADDDKAPPPRSKEDKIVEARMKLRQRFFDRMKGSPAMADDQPGGSGPPNRHGMPRLPPGQYETKAWPVLDLGLKPEIPLSEWRLVVDGACETPLCLDWQDFLALEQVNDVSDFHCVTTWSKMDMHWKGVRFAELAALAQPTDQAEFVMCHGYDRYTVNLTLAEALKPDVLLVHTVNGQSLPVEHGGPVRMITPQLYAWKGSKWIRRIQFLERDMLGYWERRGYSNSAHPWREDRYS